MMSYLGKLLPNMVIRSHAGVTCIPPLGGRYPFPNRGGRGKGFKKHMFLHAFIDSQQNYPMMIVKYEVSRLEHESIAQR
jgi:hypothetical protein